MMSPQYWIPVSLWVGGARQATGWLLLLGLLMNAMPLSADAAGNRVQSFAQAIREATGQPVRHAFYATPSESLQELKGQPRNGQPASEASWSVSSAASGFSKPATPPTLGQRLVVSSGKSQVVTLDGPATRVTISDPSVAGVVVVSPWQVQLIGKAPGLVTLQVWQQGRGDTFRTYEVEVQRDVTLLTEQIRLIAPAVNVRPMAARNTLVLSGEVDSMEQAQLVLELTKAFVQSASANAGGGAAVSAGGTGGNGGVGTAGSAFGSNTDGGASNANAKGPLVASSVPGSSLLGFDGSVINLMRVKGMPSTKLELVKEKLSALHGNITLDVVSSAQGGEKAILTGTVPFTETIAKAVNLVSVFYGQPGIKVVAGPGGNNVLPNSANTEFHTATAFSDNRELNLLQGMVVTDTSGNVVSLLEVDQKPQIRASIKFLDVSDKATDLLGFPLSRLQAGDVVIQNDFTAPNAPAAVRQGLNNLPGGTLGLFDNRFSFTLQALQEKQLVRTLAEPTLTLLSGEKASFLAGGEVPIPVSDANGRITLEYKEFGIRLNMIATLTDDGKISLQVAPEVSSIDPSLAFSSQFINIPGIRSRRMQTTVEVLPGQSFVLAGLFSSADTETLSRFPFFGNLPIIGSFLRSNFRDKTQSELVVVIRPEVVTSEGLAVPQFQVAAGQNPPKALPHLQAITPTVSKPMAQPVAQPKASSAMPQESTPETTRLPAELPDFIGQSAPSQVQETVDAPIRLRALPVADEEDPTQAAATARP